LPNAFKPLLLRRIFEFPLTSLPLKGATPYLRNGGRKGKQKHASTSTALQHGNHISEWSIQRIYKGLQWSFTPKPTFNQKLKDTLLFEALRMAYCGQFHSHRTPKLGKTFEKNHYQH
jgi:hypothetical protein